jgi:hypothetical protein
VMIANALQAALNRKGHQVKVRHRDMNLSQ